MDSNPTPDQIPPTENAEIIRPNLEKFDLQNAIAFRIKFPEQQNQQIELINKLRTQNPPIIAVQEATDTVVGFLTTKAQVEGFKVEAAKFPNGDCAFGASRGESRVWLATNAQNEQAVMMTCEGTIAANRVTQVVKTQDLNTEKLSAYRYSPQSTEETVVGGKNTSLEKIDFDTEVKNLDENFAISIPDILKQTLTLEEPLTLTNITEVDFSVFSLDLTDFSSTIHQLSVNPENKDQLDEYLETVATFFNTLESKVRELIKASDPNADIVTIDWRGDSGGIIVPIQYRDLLILAFGMVIPRFTDKFNVKASISNHRELQIKKSPGNKALLNPNSKAAQVAHRADQEMKEQILRDKQESGIYQNNSYVYLDGKIHELDELITELIENPNLNESQKSELRKLVSNSNRRKRD